MKTLLLAGTAATLLALGTTGAQASGIWLSGGAAGQIPGGPVTNEALKPVASGGLGFNNPLGGYYGSQVYLQGGSYVVEFLGREAGANNQFRYLGGNGAPAFTINSNIAGTNEFNINGIGTSYALTLTGGLFNFSFYSPVDGGKTAANGSNPAPTSDIANFFATFQAPPGNGSAGAMSGDVLYLFFDDTGSSDWRLADDDNHDDMVIRITFVPEPTTLALFGAGLAGLGLARRARARRKAA